MELMLQESHLLFMSKQVSQCDCPPAAGEGRSVIGLSPAPSLFSSLLSRRLRAATYGITHLSSGELRGWGWVTSNKTQKKGRPDCPWYLRTKHYTDTRRRILLLMKMPADIYYVSTVLQVHGHTASFTCITSTKPLSLLHLFIYF